MWAGGDALMFLLILVVAVGWVSDRSGRDSLGRWLDTVRVNALADIGERTAPDTDADTGRLRRTTDVDTDQAALDAYNALLARLTRHHE